MGRRPHVWDVETGQAVGTIPTGGQNDIFSDQFLSADGALLVAVRQNRIPVFFNPLLLIIPASPNPRELRVDVTDVATGRLTSSQRLQESDWNRYSKFLAVAPNREVFVDGELQLWKVPNSK